MLPPPPPLLLSSSSLALAGRAAEEEEEEGWKQHGLIQFQGQNSSSLKTNVLLKGVGCQAATK